MSDQYSRGRIFIAYGLAVVMMPLPFLVLGAVALFDPSRAMYVFFLQFLYGLYALINGGRVIPGLIAVVGGGILWKYGAFIWGACMLPAAFVILGIQEAIDWSRSGRGASSLLFDLSLPVSGLLGLSCGLIGLFMNTPR